VIEVISQPVEQPDEEKVVEYEQEIGWVAGMILGYCALRDLRRSWTDPFDWVGLVMEQLETKVENY